jgi:FMN phosphatase YigB (HAD superfamily)
MANPTSSQKLSSFKVIGFDTMGTLLDERAGVTTAFAQILNPKQFPSYETPDELFNIFDSTLAAEIKRNTPPTTYQEILATACSRAVHKVSNGQYSTSDEQNNQFAAALADWPAFVDTVSAMQKLAKNAKLILVSNMDTVTLETITTTGALKDVPIADLQGGDIAGAFKPDHAVFNTFLDTALNKYGVGQKDVLLIAQGLPSDHVPAKEIGFASAWIDRYHDGKQQAEKCGAKPTWIFESLQQLVDEMDRE